MSTDTSAASIKTSAKGPSKPLSEIAEEIAADYEVKVKPSQEGEFHASLPQFPKITANAKTADEAEASVREQVKGIVETLLNAGLTPPDQPFPRRFRKDFSQENRTSTLTVRITRTEHKKLARDAEKAGMSLSDYMRTLINNAPTIEDMVENAGKTSSQTLGEKVITAMAQASLGEGEMWNMKRVAAEYHTRLNAEIERRKQENTTQESSPDPDGTEAAATTDWIVYSKFRAAREALQTGRAV